MRASEWRYLSYTRFGPLPNICSVQTPDHLFIDAATGLAIQHAIMLPAMLGVMLWRYDEYAHVHYG